MLPSLNSDTLNLVADALAQRAFGGDAVTAHTVADFVHTWTDGGLRDDESATVARLVLEKLEDLRDDEEARAEAEMDMQAARERGEYEVEADDGPSTRARGYSDMQSPYRDAGADY